jgi:putative redox protein
MLLEKKRLEIMREETKKLMAKLKTSAPEQAFLRQIRAEARQVKNLQIRAAVGKHTLNIDEPLEGGGDDTAQSPVDTLLASLAACIEVNWIAYSSAFNLDIREAVVEVEGTIDRRFLLSGTNSVPARLKAVKIISHIVTSAPRENVERVHQKVQQTCPVSGSLHPDIKKEYSIEIQEPKG